MSVEFRLKYIEDTINQNINEILLKWNARKVVLNEPFDENKEDICPACMESGKQSYLQYFYVNINEAVYKCQSAACLYPFRNFKYKNYTDRTIFRYERITEADERKLDEKIFPSPTKIEQNDLADFNLSWLDNAESDLDSILAAPSDGMDCDMKEIINNICNSVGPTSTSFNTPSKLGSEQSPRASTPKLSKCLKYIEHLSPTYVAPENENLFSSKVLAGRRASETKSKISRKSFQNNKEIIPPSSVLIEQQQLNVHDWLDVVSKLEPHQIQEFQFTSPTQVTKMERDHPASSITDSSQPNNSTERLFSVEFLSNSSNGYNGRKISYDSKACVSSDAERNETFCKSMPIIDMEAEMEVNSTSNECQIIVSRTNTSTTTATSTFVTGETLSLGLGIAETETYPTSNLPEQCASFIFKQLGKGNPENNKLKRTNTAKAKRDEKKAKRKLQREEMKKLKQLEKARLRKEVAMKKREEKRNKMKQFRKIFNIEKEEDFLGFEPLEPFQPLTLKSKPLVWIKIE